jgi:hypothetical protein
MGKQIIFWIIAFIITAGSAVYQRMTGPTYPLKGERSFEGNKIVFKFERSHEGSYDHTVSLEVPDKSISGFLVYRRFKSNDTLIEVPMRREGNILSAEFPGQPPAGKIQYYVKLTKGLSFIDIPEEPVVLRFKGMVPIWVLIPHIIIIFAAMLFSTRSGLEVIGKNPKPKNYVLWTFILLVLGGFILGPIIQKFAFGEFWTGFPFGTDLTDNKTTIGLLGWLIALIATRKGKPARAWVLGAAILMLVIYLIPHSLLGSEVDYTKVEKKIEVPLR